MLIQGSQGAKAAQKRERNAQAKSDKGPTSRIKVNEAAKNIICQTCKQTFVRYSCYRISMHLTSY